jgi:hypothetical protein
MHDLERLLLGVQVDVLDLRPARPRVAVVNADLEVVVAVAAGAAALAGHHAVVDPVLGSGGVGVDQNFQVDPAIEQASGTFDPVIGGTLSPLATI